MTLALLSLAGIPPLAGFFGKYMVFAVAIESGFTKMVILAILTSLVGVYYYFKIIIAMYFAEPEGEPLAPTASMQMLLVVLTAVSLMMSVFADFLVSLIPSEIFAT